MAETVKLSTLLRGSGRGVCISNHGLNSLIYTIRVLFGATFTNHVFTYYRWNKWKTIHIYTVYFADAEMV